MKNKSAFFLGLLCSFGFVLAVLYVRQRMFTQTGPLILQAGEEAQGQGKHMSLSLPKTGS